jgi:hypothetical protein
MPLTVAM